VGLLSRRAAAFDRAANGPQTAAIGTFTSRVALRRRSCLNNIQKVKPTTGTANHSGKSKRLSAATNPATGQKPVETTTARCHQVS